MLWIRTASWLPARAAYGRRPTARSATMLRPIRFLVRLQVSPLLGVLALGAGAAFATDPPPAGAPPAGAGRDLFAEKCGMCHRSSGMGTGLLARRYPKGQEQLETRSNLSAALVTSVVRHGLNN